MASETTTSFTGNQLIDAVLWGSGGASSTTAASKWNSTSMSFSFSGSWSATEQAAVTNALAFVEAVSGLTFSRSSGGTDLTFNKYTANDGYLGFGYPPDPYYGQSNTGQVHFNTYYSQYWNTADLQVGGVMFGTVVHEALHALGLGHPHDNAYRLPGVSSYADSGTYGLNSSIYTVMSYNDIGQRVNGEQLSPNSLASYGFQTLGALDIAALQHLYGAAEYQTVLANGNIVVSWESEGVWGNFARIVTPDGEFLGDQFLLNTETAGPNDQDAALITGLSDGGFVVVWRGDGGLLARVFEADGTARTGEVVLSNSYLPPLAIESLSSGGFALTYANQNNKYAYVQAYNADLQSTGPAYVLRTGSGEESLWHSSVTDTADGHIFATYIKGDDLYGRYVSAADLNITTDNPADADTLTNIENVVGGSGDDTITGDSRANRLEGGAGNDTLDGGLGDDTLVGGLGDDIYIVDSLDDVVVEVADGGFDIIRTALTDVILPDHVEQIEIVAGGGAVRMTGNAGSNRMMGGTDGDTMDGGGGDDWLFGGLGNDIFRGGAGRDWHDGGEGRDTVVYSDAASRVWVDLLYGGGPGDAEGDGYESIEDAVGSSFDDTFAGTEAANEFHGGGGNDLLSGRGGDDTLRGDDGDDTLWGGSGADRLFGGAGDDVLMGGAGIDGHDGGEGRDTVDYSDASSQVWIDLLYGGGPGEAAGEAYISIEGAVGSAYDDTFAGTEDANEFRGGGGADLLNGRGGDDTLRGDAGDDTLWGGGGDDRLYGGSGDDTLMGGAGRDWHDGGEGRDTVVYSGAGTQVWVDLLYGGGPGDAAGDGYVDIEDAVGSSFDDTFAGTEDANAFQGGGGNDLLSGRGGDDTLRGDDGDDTLWGGSGADRLFGGAGNDMLMGGAGVDRHDGGAGRDTVVYSDSASQVWIDLVYGGGPGEAAGEAYISIEDAVGSSHNDTIAGTEDANTLHGGAGADLVNGRGGDDALYGEGGDDTLMGGAGDDQLYGGTGDDRLLGDEGDDTLWGGGGDDRLYGGSGDDTLMGGAGRDWHDGGEGRDTVVYTDAASQVWVDLLYGGGPGDAAGDGYVDIEDAVGSSHADIVAGTDDANTLRGGGGDDLLNGRGGDDTLYGEAGDDTLMGGGGDDLFVFTDGGGSDTVTDFTAGTGTDDRLDLRAVSSITDMAELLAASSQDGANTVIDTGGGSSITLIGVDRTALHQDDFLF